MRVSSIVEGRSLRNKNVLVEDQLSAAVNALETDGVIAYPTEAVFGLGCNPRSVSALQRIIDIKGREALKGFILIASRQSQLHEFIATIDTRQQALLDEHWPGPVTFVVPASTAYCNTLLSGYRESIAVRVSQHPVVVALCNLYEGPIVSTSANRSGTPALRTADEVRSCLEGGLDVVLDAPVGNMDSPTQIFDLLTGQRLR